MSKADKYRRFEDGNPGAPDAPEGANKYLVGFKKYDVFIAMAMPTGDMAIARDMDPDVVNRVRKKAIDEGREEFSPEEQRELAAAITPLPATGILPVKSIRVEGEWVILTYEGGQGTLVQMAVDPDDIFVQWAAPEPKIVKPTVEDRQKLAR